MKIVVPCLLLILLASVANQRLAAQILEVNQFKTTIYNQTNAAPPAAPNFPDAYFFGTYVDTDPDYFVTNLVVTVPNGDACDLNDVNSDGTNTLGYGSYYYANETNFDGEFAGGTYDYNYDFTDASSNTYNVDIILDLNTNDLYAASIPAFTPACWTAMQTVDPAQDFILSWNAYTLTPGADYAETFISISDQVTGNTVSSPNGPPGFTFTNIPPGTLQYGRVYQVNLYFSERQNPVNLGYGDVTITTGWDNLTQTTLITLPLWLQIAQSGANVVLLWPADATNYLLETTASLSPAGPWSGVTNNPVVMGATNSVTLPAGNTSAFFRLATAGN